MNQAPQLRRFKANPIEVAILSVTALIFCNSLYNLFYQQNGFNPSVLVPMTANPTSEGRKLASIPQNLMTWDISSCDKTVEIDTPSTRVRLNGLLCKAGKSQKSQSVPFVKATVVNSTNQYEGTLFGDSDTDQFSTDYIPLDPGKNVIQLEISYSDSDTFTQELVVNRL